MEGGVVISSRVVKVIFEKKPERHEEVCHAGICEKNITSSAKALPVQKLYHCRRSKAWTF